MFRYLKAIALVTLALLPLGVGGTFAKSETDSTYSPPAQEPVCSTICGKSGLNSAVPAHMAMDDYLRVQRLGMGWVIELAAFRRDVNRVVEAAKRAHAHNQDFIIYPFCDNPQCSFVDPLQFADFLREVAGQVDGEIWAMLGPMEPDSLGTWVGPRCCNQPGSDPTALANYINTLLNETQDIDNLKTLSPGFNLSNSYSDAYFREVEAAGARFGDLDAFAGTSYTVAGVGAYTWYRSHPDHAETMHQKVERFGKQFIFVEFGTFELVQQQNAPEGDPARAGPVNRLKNEFARAADDPNVIGILYFNALGLNPQFNHHRLYDSEMVAISEGTVCAGTGHRQAGIGVSTDQILWQFPEDQARGTCREITYGCPFTLGAAACPATACIDTDADGYLGAGGTGACVRNDCNDVDPANGLACTPSLAGQTAAWGSVYTIESNVSTIPQLVWPALNIRDNGLPIVAYHGTALGNSHFLGGRGLNVLDCSAPDCSSAVRHVLSEDFQVGTFIAAQVRASSGNTLITHLNKLAFANEAYDCFSPDCATGQNHVVSASDAGRAGYGQSMVIRNSGRPLITYWHSIREDLGAYDCADESCTTSTVYRLDTDGTTGVNPSVAIGADGNPLVAYSALSQAGMWQLRLFVCSDESCSAGDVTTLDTENAMSFGPRALAVRSSGLPVIVYHSVDTNALMLYDCTTPDCSDGVRRLLSPVDHAESASLAILPGDDSPFIAFSNNVGGDYDLMLARCLDPSCTAAAMESYTAGNVGAQPDVAIRPDGTPLVVFHDVGNGALMFYDVSFQPDPTPETPTPDTPTPDTPTPDTPTPDTPTPETPTPDTPTPDTPTPDTPTPDTPTPDTPTPDTPTPDTPTPDTPTPETPTPETSPPDCSCARASVNVLWPADHKFVDVEILGVSDLDGDPISITINSIFQDEPVDAPGSGNTSPDGQGLGTATAEVRAESVGSGNGRYYHIEFTADDGQGGTCTGTVQVRVPKSKGKKGEAIDDGPLYDSTGGQP